MRVQALTPIESRTPGSVGRRSVLVRAVTLGLVFALAVATVGAAVVQAQELAPSRTYAVGGAPMGRFSDRTVSIVLQIDRDRANLVAFTLKDRPFERPLDVKGPRPSVKTGRVGIEVALLGPGAQRYTQRVEIGGLCLEHPADAEPHVQGDTIRLHRESLLVELPEIAGFDAVEVAYDGVQAGRKGRVALATLRLTPERFTAAGGAARYEDLRFASATPAGGPEQPLLTPGTVHWPEEYGDPDKFTVYGNAAETARRINIVIVPDGYTFAQKATMQSHAQSLVNYFRSKTPYAQHDPFINYILVYAYSTESGTDQCDCSIVKDTAMATRFPLQTVGCQNSDNRCLFYGAGNGGPNCDPNTSTANIGAAELRAPARDTTLIMVNTTRYGGCGGSRAVYSAGNGSATEIAVHELGHSIAGLADEYAYVPDCGSSADEVNTSSDPSIGAWPEWIGDIGAPWEGAQYYGTCLYRPAPDCDMRSLGQPFCAVCDQQWARVIFSWYRVFPTAPIESSSPASPVTAPAGVTRSFSVVTRLGIGTTNSVVWRLEGPGFPTPTVVATGVTTYARSFAPGNYVLTCEVTADTNFIKPERNGSNVATAGWSISATAVAEVSDDAVHELKVVKNGANVDLQFEDVGATGYNLYVSKSPATAPFAVSTPGSGKRECGLAGVTSIGGGMSQISGYSLESGLTGDTSLLCFLVTADNGPRSEGSLGRDSASNERTADSYCNR